MMKMFAFVLFLGCCSAVFTQQGTKLVGTGAGGANQGRSVSLSSDGNTMAIGGPGDAITQGAVWIFTRTGSVWSQQGTALVGTGFTGIANQGTSVVLSSDGNTLAIGGPFDNSSQGAVWIFTRTGSVWSQQGAKLVGTGNIGFAYQGTSVSLSSDGNTLAVGGPVDNSSQGAVWIFTRTGTVWSQQGAKLVGTGAVGASQGTSVSLSSNGNTLAVGGPVDFALQGAVWIFTRTASVWSQQGTKLVGTGVVGAPQQGRSVSLSSDGNTLAIGGQADNINQGAVWIFTRTGTVWSQQGAKLVGTGAVGGSSQGTSVSLSSDGNILSIGGFQDDAFQGAVWIFTRIGSVWSQQGTKLVGTGAVGAAHQGTSVSLSSDGNTLANGGVQDNAGQGTVWIFVSSTTTTTTVPMTTTTTTPVTTTTSPPSTTTSPSTTTPPAVAPCFHKDTVITYAGKDYPFQEIRAHPECSIPHVVSAYGVIVTGKCGHVEKTLKLTDGHLVYTQRGLQAAVDLKPRLDTLFADLAETVKCQVVSVTKQTRQHDYFGLNCLNSQVLANGLKASTFEKLHSVPSFWMQVMGRILGIKRASKLGDYIAEMVQKMNLL